MTSHYDQERERLDAKLRKVGAMHERGGIVAISPAAVESLPVDLRRRYLYLHDTAFDRGCDLGCGWIDPAYCQARIWERANRTRPAGFVSLSSMHTRQLLDALTLSRGDYGFWSPEGEWGPGYSSDEIKAELAHRPHIPNKQEAKAARRAAAQGKA